jgi:hypothetical protein
MCLPPDVCSCLYRRSQAFKWSNLKGVHFSKNKFLMDFYTLDDGIATHKRVTLLKSVSHPSDHALMT